MMERRALRNRTCAIVTAMLIVAGCGRTITQGTDDTTITTRVKTALLNDRTVNGTAINVSTANRVVTLSGRVRTAQERERAITVARGTVGVDEVRSALEIGGSDDAVNTGKRIRQTAAK